MVIRLLAPTSSKTLPKTQEPLNTLTLLPHTHETIQELKLAINEWVGGYWLGPYSLRIPHGKGKKQETAEGISEVKEGEKLSEYFEVGDVFAGFEEDDERVLEVVRGEVYSTSRVIPSSHQNHTPM